MRGRRILLAALIFGCAIGPVTAHAQPAAPSPVIPDPLRVNGIGPQVPPLEQLQRWIAAVVPPPPLVAGDRPASGRVGATPDPDLLRRAVLPDDVGDRLLDEWPPDLAHYREGQIVATRNVTATAAPLVTVPVREVTQLKFRTDDASGGPSYATATLVIPAQPWTGPTTRPVLVNNLAIDGLGRRCTPGYTYAHGLSGDTDSDSLIPPTTQLALLRGYAVLLPDHEGPRMAYAEPYVAGHAVLDAIRAVRARFPAEFGTSHFALHGYSGGAIATRGAVALIASYAPELRTVIAGAALGGVPVDYRLLSRSMNANLASGVFFAATFGIGRERPQILARMNNLARWVAVSPLRNSCSSTFSIPGLLSLPIDVAADIPDPLDSALAADIFRVTGMRGMKSVVPLYIYNGDEEFWVPAAGARELYDDQCALGVRAVYRGVPGEHFIATATGYPGAMTWVDQRLRGIPAPDEC
ncbi:MAG: lipase [Nocardia sp.]|nr:lipase [Nocardia sp.]